MAMPTSIIKVYDSRRGESADGIKVQLQWNGFVNLGVSDTVYTDRSGRVIINHSATGEAEVYIKGNYVGKMYTPGSETFEI